MRTIVTFLLLLTTVSFGIPAFAQETQRTDVVMEKMAFKLVRGFTNAVTCVAELPKQTYLSSRDRGAVGFAIGPLKGIGMTLYRAFSGVAESVFFMVPQPGYYDSMINPDYVWKGWEETRPDTAKPKDVETAEGSDASKEK